jgi:exopolysaccharide biosynthesis polyprenyl glycosylphosphotransferase
MEAVDSLNSPNFFSEDHFRRMLSQERKRSERSRKHLVLMLVDGKTTSRTNGEGAFLKQIADVVCATIRETDLVGWYEANSVLGAVFTELGSVKASTAVQTIEAKIRARLQKVLKPNQLSHFRISFYVFPEDWVGERPERRLDQALYPDLFEAEHKRKLSLLTKRGIDIIGSVLALIVLSPLFFILALVIKLTSKGPILFRQKRVGQYGVPFVFLKFRSMQVSTDAGIHKEYVRNFIAGKAKAISAEANQKAVYKITNDPRVTRIGRFMRRTSLDELPQFLNVLKGEMSLVGPRPPIPYEIADYDIWHRRRVLEVKPGITGLWQVHGRSRTTFDEMVRLDLQYSRTWSPLLDVKILLQTPRAVLSGNGAY